MRHVVLLVAVVALLAGTIGTADAHRDATTAICHRTASKTKPYQRLRVTGSALRAHGKHAADIIPAPAGGCPKTLLTAAAGGTTLQAAMTGETENPAGDPVATGTATIRLRAGQGQVCYRINAANLPTPAVASHIHRAAAGAVGPVVVPLATPNAAGQAAGCAAAPRTVVKAILAAPASFYVNVHTSGFPGGAIRGQLSGTSTASFGTVLNLQLKGTSEPNASGTAIVRIRKDAATICYRLHVENVTLPTVAAHIHRGGAGVNGPVVFPMNAPGADGNASGCAAADATLIDEILANQAGFYVNVHTKEHPAGAIRAQLD